MKKFHSMPGIELRISDSIGEQFTTLETLVSQFCSIFLFTATYDASVVITTVLAFALRNQQHQVLIAMSFSEQRISAGMSRLREADSGNRIDPGQVWQVFRTCVSEMLLRQRPDEGHRDGELEREGLRDGYHAR